MRGGAQWELQLIGFRIKDEIKAPNFSMSEIKSEWRAGIAETATKELGIKVSSRNIETVFQL